MEPLVSVIIPVYNVAPYLREALDSVIHQTYRNLEILIVDDGSTDESGSICDEYLSDPRVTVIHQENKGLSNARNVGLDLMTGEYVGFLDPDDAFHPGFIEELLKIMISEHPDIAVCKYTKVVTTGRILEEKKRKAFGPRMKQGKYGRIESLRALVDGRLNTSVWNKLYRKEIWNDIRFPDGHNYEDMDTLFRIINICDTVYVTDQDLYYHRMRKGSITQTISKKNIDDKNLAYAHLDAFVLEHIPEIFSQDQVKKTRQSCINTMMVQYVKNSVDPEFARELKRQIIDTGKKAEDYGLRTRVAFLLFRISPWLLKVSYSIYYPMRLLVLKVTGK